MASIHPNPGSQTTLALDANAASATPPYDMGSSKDYAVQVVANSGASSVHIVTVEESNDNVGWKATSTTVAQVGLSFGNSNSRYLRVKVSTIEGAASTIDVFLIVK